MACQRSYAQKRAEPCIAAPGAAAGEALQRFSTSVAGSSEPAAGLRAAGLQQRCGFEVEVRTKRAGFELPIWMPWERFAFVGSSTRGCDQKFVIRRMSEQCAVKVRESGTGFAKPFRRHVPGLQKRSLKYVLRPGMNVFVPARFRFD